ncbi:hypothetical protein AB205_0069430 [Aquarana catesbeiana]|uniref:MADF domain-containing protein n=1 Tax=Aquarana catesbeiana TaxID=8400 RepID=A0A2G9QMK7_AQUCT|nr:hypothetical protein AB205_0069430 [Aquarana catesbeiana]
MSTISTISIKPIFEALNLLRNQDISGSGLSSSLLLLHTCCVSAMFLSHCDEREGVGNILERTSGAANMKQFKDPEFMGQFLYRYRDMRNLWEVKNLKTIKINQLGSHRWRNCCNL